VLDISPRSMVRCGLPEDRNSGQPIAESTPLAQSERVKTMLNAANGMMAMLPVAFWIAGYVLVSR